MERLYEMVMKIIRNKYVTKIILFSGGILLTVFDWLCGLIPIEGKKLWD